MRPTREAGQVLPMVALMFTMLTGFAGASVDVGYWEYQQRQQQSATDAAALGAAQALVYAGCPSSSTANTTGQTDASKNGFTNGTGNTSVSVSNPPTTGAFLADSCAVQVTISRSKVAAFFSRAFGKSLGVSETTTAIATLTTTPSGGTPCVYLLDTSGSTNFNGANVTATQCAIEMNGTANFNGAKVSAERISYAGAAPNTNGATFTQASPTAMLPIADPCPEIAGCAYLTAHPPSSSGCIVFNGNGFKGSLNPGCYSSLNLNGATVTLNPGTYVLSGSSNFNGASVTGSGVTLYVPMSGSPPNFNGVQNMTLSPPSSGNYAGVLYYQDPGCGNSAPNFNGSSETLSGLIYAPTASVNFNGANGGYLTLVFGSANFNGGTAQDFGGAASGSSVAKAAVLAE
jgi:hypothetical protein